MNELIRNWQWDIYHIGATLFILLIAGAVIWIIQDSIHKQKKVNGKKESKLK